MQRFANAKVLAGFAELVFRLQAGNDATYLRLRQRVSLAGIGLESQQRKMEKRREKMAGDFAFGKISAGRYLAELGLLDYAVERQSFNMMLAAEQLYLHLAKYAGEKKLKLMLGVLKFEAMRSKKAHYGEIKKIEKEFRKRKDLGGWP